MLAREVVEKIRGMLLTGNCSERTIARMLGVSRGAVKAIAEGKRRLSTPLKRSPWQDFPSPRGPHVRCPSCGGKVQMPCLACYLRRER